MGICLQYWLLGIKTKHHFKIFLLTLSLTHHKQITLFLFLFNENGHWSCGVLLFYFKYWFCENVGSRTSRPLKHQPHLAHCIVRFVLWACVCDLKKDSNVHPWFALLFSLFWVCYQLWLTHYLMLWLCMLLITLSSGSSRPVAVCGCQDICFARLFWAFGFLNSACPFLSQIPHFVVCRAALW